jgi:hypothetical protein
VVRNLKKILAEHIRWRVIAADENGWLAYSAGFLLAVAVGLYTTWELIGSNGLYLLLGLPSFGDLLQTLSGFDQFLLSEWSYPLFFVSGFSYPEGMSILYTDSLPWLALVVKLFASDHVRGYHILPIMLTFSFCLQAVGCVYLCRSVRLGATLPIVFLLIFCLTASWFVGRIPGHITLAAQGFLLIGLGLAIRIHTSSDSAVSATSEIVFLGGLSILLLFHHFYLFLMLNTLFLLVLFRSFMKNVLERKFLFCLGVGYVVLVVSLMELGGYFPGGIFQSLHEADTTRFGHHSANLAALFTYKGGEYPTLGTLFGLTHDGTGGQTSGALYLGWGGILIVIVSLTIGAREWISVGLKYWEITLAIMGLWVYSLLDAVYFSEWLLVDLPLDGTLIGDSLSVLHANGRFGWLFGYSVIFLSVFIIQKKLARRPKIRSGIFAIGLVLVFSEGVGEIERISDGWDSERSKSDQHFIAAAVEYIRPYRRIFVYPSFRCNHPENVAEWKSLLTVQYLASMHGIETNEVYSARGGKDCSEERKALVRIEESPNGVLVITRDMEKLLEEVTDVTCKTVQGTAFCQFEGG